MKTSFLLVWIAFTACAQTAAHHQVHALKIRILSTNVADPGLTAEWGFSALVEADGKRILVDTGAQPDTVLRNLNALHIDLSDVTDLVLTHNHGDHTGGVVTLRQAMMKKNSMALSRIYAAKGILLSRTIMSAVPVAATPPGEGNGLLRKKTEYEASGGRIVEYDRPVELAPGVWLLANVPRKYPEHNYPTGGVLQAPEGPREDTIPEDTALAFDTEQGLVVLSGCGHAGIANTLDYARTVVRNAPIYAAIGGWHLYGLDDEKLTWTAAKLREFGLQNFLGAHCTGTEAVYRIRQLNGMTRSRCSVAAVGATFELGRDMSPGVISR